MGFTVVTGLGPRVGSSFVMRMAKESGLPVVGDKFPEGWCVPEHNPEGYWEFPPDKLNKMEAEDTKEWEGKIVKLWFPSLLKVGMTGVDKILLLRRRELSHQVKSIEKCMVDEFKLPNIINQDIEGLTATDILRLHYNGLERWLYTVEKYPEILDVYTEDIDNQLDNILSFLES